VPIADSYDLEDRSFVAVVREAKSGRTDHGFVFIALAVNSAAGD